jgi:hypothetical protein
MKTSKRITPAMAANYGGIKPTAEERIERNLYAIPPYDNDYFQLKDIATIASVIAETGAQLQDYCERIFSQSFDPSQESLVYLPASMTGNGRFTLRSN